MGYKHQIEDIIAAGSELFRKEGYSRVGINDILKECNIPKGSFYNFFYSKEDFAQQVLESYGNASIERMREFMQDASKSPVERLRSFYGANIDINEADGLNAGCLVGNMAIELAGVNDKLSRQIDSIMNEWFEILAGCIAEGQQLGEITAEMPARDLAEYIHSGFNGAFTRMKSTRSRDYLDKWHDMTFQFIGT